MTSDVKDRVIAIVKKHFGNPNQEITESTDFINDLNADSLGRVEFLLSAEDEFEIEITEDKAESIKTVGDAIAYIEAELQNKAKAA